MLYFVTTVCFFLLLFKDFLDSVCFMIFKIKKNNVFLGVKDKETKRNF